MIKRLNGLIAAIAVPLFWFVLGATFIVAISPMPPSPPGAPSDKVQHIMAFSVLTTLCLIAYSKLKWQRIWLGLGFFGVLIECVQVVPALGRYPEWSDIAADIVAISAVLLLWRMVQYTRQIGRG